MARKTITLAAGLLLVCLLSPAGAQPKPITHPVSPTEGRKTVTAGPIDDQLTPPDLSNQPTAVQIKQQNADEDAAATGLVIAGDSQQAALMARIRRSLAAPAPGTDAEAVQKQLDDLINDAGQLAVIAEPGPLQLKALSLQMQSLYSRIERWPNDPQVDRYLFRLRAAARRTKTLDQADAPAVADFWLMTADLYDINRLDLPTDQRVRQMQELFDAYLADHGAGPTSDAVRAMVTQLTEQPTPAPKPNAEPPAGGEASDKTPPNPEPSTGANQAVEIPTPMPPKPNAEQSEASDGEASDNKASAPDPTPSNQPAIRPLYEIGKKVPGLEGVTRYLFRSRYQPGDNFLRVLTPDKKPDPTQKLRILLVLPVEAGLGDQFGDGLATVKRLDLHNKYNLIVVEPTFSALPWYCNHPNDADLQQESYIAKAVVPAVDELFPGAKHRLLLGFSKSGFGAVSLAVRYMEIFDAAAAWDAPLLKDKPDNYGMGPIFGSQQNFDLYNLARQFREKSRYLRKDKRLVLTGYDHFREHMQRAHNLLDQLEIPHIYADGPQRRHHWDSGWVPEAVEQLVKLIEPKSKPDAEQSEASGSPTN